MASSSTIQTYHAPSPSLFGPHADRKVKSMVAALRDRGQHHRPRSGGGRHRCYKSII
jgi:hypothetical protein